MIRYIFSLIMLAAFSCNTSYAQVEHMKFMGIPLDGTINQFQAKLNAKGITVDAVANKGIAVGCRVFKGGFSGKEAQIYVYYDETTKVVYRAKAVIQTSYDNICDNNYNYFVSMLKTKYYNAETESGRQDGYDSITFLIPADILAEYKYLGTIDVYRSTHLSLYYMVHVDYTDTINVIKHENRNLEDL